jgi:hypothetical protein
LAGFFLNNALLIPPVHFFPIARLILWFGFGGIAHREAYMDLETWNTDERKDHPIEGRFRWLSVGLLLSELILCWRYREGTGNIIWGPTPFYIWGSWAAGFGALALLWLYLRFKPSASVKYPGINKVNHEKEE